VATWLDLKFADGARAAVLAHEGDQLVGWLLLATEGPDTVEVNPWFFGGHPIVAPGVDWPTTAGLLLDEAARWAEEQGIGRIRLVTGMAENNSQDAEHETFYQQQGFTLTLKYVEMICPLSDVTLPAVNIPPGYEIAPLATASMNELYDCYYRAFSAGDARFFFDQGEAERREYFDTLGYPESVGEPASITLYHDGRLAGFVYSLPHGDNNHHISCMCVLAEFQGQELGRLLLYEVMNRVSHQGHKSITLGTEPEMRAYDLYIKNGFQVTGGAIIYTWENPSDQ
jgi:ribosomal protein S18 acetylase RimI-like enzyme